MNVLLTGATGFLGEYLLAELLERGHTVWGLYRSDSRMLDTVRFLSSLGLPRHAGDLRWLKGDVLEADVHWKSWLHSHPGLSGTDTLLHCAASTQLHMDGHGEPLRTNLGSAQSLKRLAQIHPLRTHLISTAYVCGKIRQGVVREELHPRGDFVNVYEESKWESEALWAGEATLLRPSVIVGDSVTGRCTSFSGWYVLMQSLQLLSRLLGEKSDGGSFNLNLRLPVEASATLNLVPVDYVAAAAARLIEDPANHRGVFHLTHPNPPSHRLTWDFVGKKFGVTGLEFAGADADQPTPRDDQEQLVFRQMQAIFSYLGNNPIFSRTFTDRALPCLKPPEVDEASMNRWVDYATAQDWGQ